MDDLASDFALPMLCGEELRKIARANAEKAHGVDTWAPRHWALLPVGFFDALAIIWNTILQNGAAMPNSWMDVRAVLIPEEPGEKRPVSIAVIAWRVGISALMHRMRGWINTWVPEEVTGGIPGRGAAELHEEMQESIWECLQQGTPFAGCKVDLRKCFDKANAEKSILILERLGLPHQIGDVLRVFYTQHRKWCELDGACTREPVTVTNGLLQGCPASMLLLAAQATLWVKHVREKVPEVRLGVYVDDRALIATWE